MDSKYTYCKFDPFPLRGMPIGMFHCPECGGMVLAGMPHPVCPPEVGHTMQDGACIDCGARPREEA
jgi:hypothetical protein